MDTLLLIILLILALATGLLAALYAQSRQRARQAESDLQERLQRQQKEMEALHQKTLLQFETLANKIFEEKTDRFSKNSLQSISHLLNPLKENLQEFKKQVAETYDKESKQRFSLEDRIKELVALNQQISKDATNLTKALKGQTKTQGNWGEMILESILEQSGLGKDREYFVQQSYRDSDGKRKQPDVVIRYPDDRKIIIDAKVSLTAYERFVNADDSEEQKQHLDEHLRSLRTHIDQLSAKGYEKMERTLDFVMLFVPIEPAYLAAMQYDPELWNYAYKKRILLISPTNLIAALKMVADIWNREKQNVNALEIARRGELLYDKFVGFVNDLDELGKALGKATDKYDSALGKLKTGRGNLIAQAETLRGMGLNPSKTLPDKHLPDTELSDAVRPDANDDSKAKENPKTKPQEE